MQSHNDKMFDTVLHLNKMQETEMINLEELESESDPTETPQANDTTGIFGGDQPTQSNISFIQAAQPSQVNLIGGFGGFGAFNASQPQTFGGFGTTPASTFGGFGASTGSFGATGGLFGSSSVNNSGGFNFGGAQNNMNGGLFGSSSAGTFGGGGSLFGGSSSGFGGNTGFGSSANTYPFNTQSSFGQSNALGNSNQNLFGVQNQMNQNFSNFNQQQQYNQFGGIQQQTSFGGGFGQNNLFGSSNDYLNMRESQPSQFQALEDAWEYSETNYYQYTNVFATSVANSKYWADLAAHIVKTGSIAKFQSSSFIFAYSNFVEIILSWAVLDLDYTSQRHAIRASGSKGISIKPESNIIIFKKEIKEAEAELDTNLLVVHRFFEYNNKNSDTKLKEYLTNQVYGCEVIMTNVSSKLQNFQILWQIPEGSLPIMNTTFQKSETKQLGAYSTSTFEFYFYFPYTGNFTQFPSNITIEGKVVAVANKCSFEVRKERKVVSFETFKDILMSGDKQKILEFLETKNLLNSEKGYTSYDLQAMLGDKEFYYQTLEVLRKRKLYDHQIWKFAFEHNDVEGVKEYLLYDNLNMSKVGEFFETTLIKCKPEYSNFRHLDYFPIVNARAHSVGKNINAGLLNIEFKQHYLKFLQVMVQKPSLDQSDWLQVAYYFLLQDRIKETIQIVMGDIGGVAPSSGLKISQKIHPEEIKEGSALKLQYDYMMAYLDFFTGLETNFKIARSIAKEYEDYPVISWRILFTEILDQIAEYDGEELPDIEIDQNDEDKGKANLKKSKMLEPFIESEIEGKHVSIEYANVAKVKINYYVIDLEVLFSRTPFLIKNTEDLANAKPIRSVSYTLDQNLKSRKIEIEEEFHDKNVMIEVHCEYKQQFLTYFSNSMKVTLIEDFGELKVTDKEDNKLPKVYIKTIAQYNDGTIKFFKDGYTDIRGKFEYAQINSQKMDQISKFAILVMSDHHGALTKEAKPPRNIKQELRSKDLDMGFLKPQQLERYKARVKKC